MPTASNPRVTICGVRFFDSAAGMRHSAFSRSTSAQRIAATFERLAPVSSASRIKSRIIAFGFRNFANYNKGLAEMLRVLEPGGMAAILEFSQPENAHFARAYDWFSTVLLPRIGGLISGSRQAYSYLPESIRLFPQPDEFSRLLEGVGFQNVTYRTLTNGIAVAHRGEKTLNT